MIHYQLRCSQAHPFDGWFKDSTTFEDQAQRRLIECPECGDTSIERALMAPALAKREALPVPVAQPSPPPEQQAMKPEKTAGGQVPAQLPAQMLAVLQRMRAEVEKHCDYVGPSFADEARKMQRGESEHRGIYGETSDEQAESLAEDGIVVTRIPWVPRADG